MQNRTEGYRLSPQQKRAWLLQQTSLAYRSQTAIRIDGHLQPSLLQQAINQAISDNEILRTTFHRQPGMIIPFQVISQVGDCRWAYLDYSGLSLSEQEQESCRLIEQEAQQPFNYEQGPVLRATLMKVSEGRHILVVSLPSVC